LDVGQQSAFDSQAARILGDVIPEANRLCRIMLPEQFDRCRAAREGRGESTRGNDVAAAIWVAKNRGIPFVAVRFIAMGVVLAITAVGILFSTLHNVTIFIVILAAVMLLVLFFGTEKQVRPILFVFRPLIWIIQLVVGIFD